MTDAANKRRIYIWNLNLNGDCTHLWGVLDARYSEFYIRKPVEKVDPEELVDCGHEYEPDDGRQQEEARDDDTRGRHSLFGTTLRWRGEGGWWSVRRFVTGGRLTVSEVISGHCFQNGWGMGKSKK